MKLITSALALATSALTLATPAFAQDEPSPRRGGGMGMGMMMRADTNGDGAVSRDEALAQAAQRFDRMDLNHDGKLTRDEIEQVGRRMGQMRGDMPPPPPQPQN